MPSPKVATHDLQPEMSARNTEKLQPLCREKQPDFVCLNFANTTDMVGPPGVLLAAVTAAQTVDECLGKIIPFGLEKGYGLSS